MRGHSRARSGVALLTAFGLAIPVPGAGQAQPAQTTTAPAKATAPAQAGTPTKASVPAKAADAWGRASHRTGRGLAARLHDALGRAAHDLPAADRQLGRAEAHGRVRGRVAPAQGRPEGGARHGHHRDADHRVA